MTPVSVIRGSGPIILAFPHGGTFVPDDVAARLNGNGRLLADTDWHIEKLYDGLLPSATRVVAQVHRYVIDANRDPGGQSLYPGQNTTGLCPLTDFDGKPIWIEGAEPAEQDMAARILAFHAPYHAALAAEVARIKSLHGVAVVYDCHSIRSRIPFLFEGTLPPLNIGTDNGRTCNRKLQDIAHKLAVSSPYSTVLNGRFRGGWTTRHYGQPAGGVHAIQMEIAQAAYLASEAPPFEYDDARAKQLRRWLTDILSALHDETLLFAKDTAA